MTATNMCYNFVAFRYSPPDNVTKFIKKNWVSFSPPPPPPPQNIKKKQSLSQLKLPYGDISTKGHQQLA